MGCEGAHRGARRRAAALTPSFALSGAERTPAVIAVALAAILLGLVLGFFIPPYGFLAAAAALLLGAGLLSAAWSPRLP